MMPRLFCLCATIMAIASVLRLLHPPSSLTVSTSTHNTGTRTTTTAAAAAASANGDPKKKEPSPFAMARIAAAAAQEAASSLTRTTQPAISTTDGAVVCAVAMQNVDAGVWTDPNRGILYARQLETWPHFIVSLHNERYDGVRWRSIYQTGAYYETHVHHHFVDILLAFTDNTNNNKQNPKPSVTVLDVGMNIGYYSLLSASLGADTVVAFEINPTNILRMCESIRLNEFAAVVDIYRRGVSNVDNEELHISVPSNPGMAKMVMAAASTTATTEDHGTGTTGSTSKSEKSHNKEDEDDGTVVKTITLDKYAQEQGWLTATSSSSSDSNANANRNFTVAILKIDVEGVEPQVLLGAKLLLQSGLVQNVLTEFRNMKSKLAQEALTLLLDSGYRVVNKNGEWTSLAESHRLLDRLGRHPTLLDPNKDYSEKLKSWVSQTFVVDLWFALAPPPSAHV